MTEPSSAHQALAGPRVAVAADDLAWATRLASIVRRAGAIPVPVADEAALEAALAGREPGVRAVIVDLAGRRYDGVALVARAHAAGRPVIAAGQHTAAALRRRALAAGAARVYAYSKLFEDGPAVVAAWLAAAEASPVGRP